MSLVFNADEILDIAVTIEENGAKFYRKAAAGAADKPTVEVFERLAAMEDNHVQIFTDMKNYLKSKEREDLTFDPDEQTALYLKAIADNKVFDVRKDPSDLLTGAESVKDVLRIAIGLEKDSITFYVGIKESVPAKSGKDKIDNIIKEEMSHVTLLSSELKALKT